MLLIQIYCTSAVFITRFVHAFFMYMLNIFFLNFDYRYRLNVMHVLSDCHTLPGVYLVGLHMQLL